MKNKKGFTLVELLAVIVILAIISLIAVPIVLKVIENSKESAALRGAEIYIDAVETKLAAVQLDAKVNSIAGTYKITKNGIQKGTEKEILVSIKGKRPVSDGEITVSERGKITSISGFVIDGYEIELKNNKLSIKGKTNVETEEEEKEQDTIEATTLESSSNSIVLESSNDSNIIDYKLYGNSIEDSTNLYTNKRSSGFIPTGAFPTVNNSYPNATYELVSISKGQVYKIDVSNVSKCVNGRIRYIDGDYNKGTIEAKTTTYYISDTNYISGFKNGNIGAIKNFTLGLLFLDNTTINCLTIHEMKSLGNRVSDSNDSNYGKYKITLKVTGSDTKNYDIYLDEPLRKSGDSVDYIDFKTGKIYRNVSSNGLPLSSSTSTDIKLPEIINYKGDTKIEVISETSPSKLVVTYNKIV